jgi:hypothetical protein
MPFDQEDKPDRCIYCGEPAKKLAFFGRAY